MGIFHYYPPPMYPPHSGQKKILRANTPYFNLFLKEGEGANENFSILSCVVTVYVFGGAETVFQLIVLKQKGRRGQILIS